MIQEKIREAYNGFEAIPRHWDRQQSKVIARVDPGDFYITSNDELVYTRLGSCVAACIWDPVLGIGGLNHFLLPERDTGKSWEHMASYSCRYGYWAMEQLINSIQQVGGQRHRFKSKIFGGAKMSKGTALAVGQSNIAFVRQYLDTEGIEVLAEDLGGTCPRKVLFHPNSGRVKVKRLSLEGIDKLTVDEGRYMRNIAEEPLKQDIELFS